MFNKGISLRFWGTAITLILVLTACSPAATTRVGGNVQGVVYADLNGNGVVDSGEGPLEGVIISLSGCGSILTQTTAADGKFNFTNLPEGSCLVSASENGWIFSGSTPSLGYPVPVASNPDLPTSFSMEMAPVAAYLSTSIASPLSSPAETLTEAMTMTLSATDTPTFTPTDTPTSTPTDTETPTPFLAVLVSPTNQDVNCRVGPSMAWLDVGALKKGQSAAVLGTNDSHSWWVIDNSFYIPGTTCWVSGAVTAITGDVTLVPVLTTPRAWVTLVDIATAKVVHGTCGGSNATTFDGAITTNGPTTVTFHWEIYTTSGILLSKTSDQQLVFTSYGTQHVDPGSYSTDCGDYYIELIITSPNAKTKQAFWSVVSP
jgi:uncharacterized protein YceK